MSPEKTPFPTVNIRVLHVGEEGIQTSATAEELQLVWRRSDTLHSAGRLGIGVEPRIEKLEPAGSDDASVTVAAPLEKVWFNGCRGRAGDHGQHRER